MKTETIPAGLLETNCYLVLDETSRTLYVIDPGGDAERIVAAARKFEFEKCYILLTHYHIDHVAAAGETAKQLNAAGTFLRKASKSGGTLGMVYIKFPSLVKALSSLAP